jgi:hypothetical protein
MINLGISFENGICFNQLIIKGEKGISVLLIRTSRYRGQL